VSNAIQKAYINKARAGEIKNFTGIDSEYEIPEKPEVIVNAQELNVEQCADKIIQYLEANQIIFSQ
jgi:adenylylsulfate kinase